MWGRRRRVGLAAAPHVVNCSAPQAFACLRPAGRWVGEAVGGREAAPQGPQRGYSFAVSAVTEPRLPRAIAFTDGVRAVGLTAPCSMRLTTL